MFNNRREDNTLIERLMHSYRPLILHVIKRYLSSFDDIEEAESRVWSEVRLVAKRFHTLDSTDEKNLLCTIARRKAIDVYRARIRNDYEPLENVENYINNFTDDQLAESIAIAIDSLLNSDKELLLLRFKYGYSVAEISKVLNCKKTTVYKRIERAKERLASILLEDGIHV